MTEKLLQFIWRFQYFNNKELQLDSGENLQIIFPGQHNLHQGPDFHEAKIKIEKTILAGNIELHVQASDWHKHAHDGDKNYNNIILHVVWQNDEPGLAKKIPTLSLNNRISKLLLSRYEELMNSSLFVPCEKMLFQVSSIVWSSWKQRLLVERLQRKSKTVEEYLIQNNHHWEETFWWMLAKNFGIKVNAEAFEAMAKSIPVNMLAKHKNQIHQLEALLFGQCGLMENNFLEDYPTMLQKEYQFLKNKYSLEPINMQVHFLRMRPGNFPTVRLAQLAMLIQKSSHLFSKIKEIQSLDELKKLLSVVANDYWNYHYVFDETSLYKEKILGRQMTENIIINTIVPVIFSYGHLNREMLYKDKALKWLEELSAEKNHITRKWAEAGIENKNAFDSQSLIELKTQYCDKRMCLACAVGNSLLKNSL
jgi:hypothetical protein